MKEPSERPTPGTRRHEEVSHQEGHASRVVIAGGSGFLAGRLAMRLRHEFPVVLFGRKPPALSELGELWIQDPMVDLEAAANRIRNLNAGVLVNCAAVLDPPTNPRGVGVLRDINARWPRLLAMVATAGEATRLIHLSTDAVFDGQVGGYSETDECNPASAYGESKREGEVGVLDSDNSALVVRTNFVGWSPRGRGFANGVLEAVLRSQPYVGYDDYFTSSIHVDQLCDSLRSLIASEASGIVHVAASDSASKADQAERLLELLDAREVNLRRSPAPDRQDRPSGLYNLSLDVSHAQTAYALRLPTIEEALQATSRELRRAIDGWNPERRAEIEHRGDEQPA